MQPEDIIQQKEWHQLNEAERRIVEPLAATQGEYNVLKKMLLIAKDDADDVPVINPSVRQDLHCYLKQPVQKKRTIIWYAAAALVIVVALATAFLLQTRKQVEGIAGHPPVVNPARQKHVDTLKKQTPPVIPPIEKEQIIVKQNDTKPVRKTPNVISNSSDNNRDIAHVNTSVKENESLLALVTEVY